MNAQLDRRFAGLEVAPWDSLPRELSWKEKIAYLGVLMSENLGSTECPVEHIFGHGVYVRKIKIPAHTVFLGREHLKGHQVTLLQGSVILITAHGKERFDAVKTVLTEPGFHMVVYTLTDVLAQTVHYNPNHLEDIGELEKEIFGSVEELRTLGLSVQRRLA